MKSNIPRVMLVGTGSGCGKTTVTCSLLKALKNRNMDVTSFKCGPDYIDPMFHSEIIGTKSRNLDVFLCGENTVKYLLHKNSKDGEIAVIEGAMGIYDGMGFEDDSFSANHISLLTHTPEILVVNVRGKSLSLAAQLYGFINFRKNNIKGVILNNCSVAMYPIYEKMLEEKLGLKTYGFLPQLREAEIGSRHLGLVTAGEIEDIKEKIEILGTAGEEYLDIDGILALGRNSEKPPFTYDEVPIQTYSDKRSNGKLQCLGSVNIAVAKDKAFCFYYEDNFDLLRLLGANLIPFSPIEDEKLPDNIQGLILGGGYPEEYLSLLSGNGSMMRSIKSAISKGLPTYAECGGFMYLGDSITKDEKTYKMVGAIRGNSHMTSGLVRFGYKTLTAEVGNMMCLKGETIRCHEFHYSDSDNNGDSFTATKGKRSWKCIVTDANVTDINIFSDNISGDNVSGDNTACGNLFAGYPHFHLWGNPTYGENFIKACKAYRGGSQWK